MSQESKQTQLGKYTDAVKKAASINLANIAIDHAAAVETQRVTDFAKKTAVDAVDMLEKLETRIKKETKPDNPLYVVNGEEVTKMDAYTAKRFEERTKLLDAFKRLSESFEKAMSTGALADFETLEKVLSQLPK